MKCKKCGKPYKMEAYILMAPFLGWASVPDCDCESESGNGERHFGAQNGAEVQGTHQDEGGGEQDGVRVRSDLPHMSYHEFVGAMRRILVGMERAHDTVKVALESKPSDQDVIMMDEWLKHWIRFMRLALK